MSSVEYPRANYPRLLGELKALLRIPSVSTASRHKRGVVLTTVCWSTLLCGCMAWGQATSVGAAPSDPNQFMRVAADAMSLTGADMKPWHVKAKYQQFKADGSLDYEGVFEEWWAGEKKYKVSYTGANFSQTIYMTADGLFLAGDERKETIRDDEVSQWLIHPLPSSVALDTLTFTSKRVSAHSIKLQCLMGASKTKSQRQARGSLAYCFSENIPVLELKEDFVGSRTSFSGISRINGHYLAGQIRSARLTASRLAPSLNIDVEQTGALTGVDDAAFTPPADAQRAPLLLSVESGVMEARLISQTIPHYPGKAQSEGIAGTVVLRARIGKDGTINKLDVTSGPVQLRQEAIDTVKLWRYEPYLLNGTPVEVETDINIGFALGG